MKSLVVWICLSGLLHAGLDVGPLTSDAALLMDAATGRVLYEKNGYIPAFPASTTKIATALFVVKERGEKIDTLVEAEHEAIASISPEAKKRSHYTAPPWWMEVGGTHIGIKKGEKLSIKDLLYGLLLVSANDAGNVLAQFMGGSISQFMSDLNAFLAEIGCQQTHFSNPHGLHHPKHITTPYDMALIMRKALEYPLFCEIIKTVKYPRPKTEKQEGWTLVQSNALIKKGKAYYPQAMGGKTGYTASAGHTFAAAASSGDRTVIAIIFKGEKRSDIYEDATALFRAAFSEQKKTKVLFRKGLQKFVWDHPKAQKPLKVYIKESVALDYYPSESPKVTFRIEWDAISPPIAKNHPVGNIALLDEQGALLKKVRMFAAESASLSWWEWIRG